MSTQKKRIVPQNREWIESPAGKRVIARVVKMLNAAGDLMAEHDLTLFCGGCGGYGALYHAPTGYKLAHLEDTQVWQGGDEDIEHDEHGNAWSPDVRNAE